MDSTEQLILTRLPSYVSSLYLAEVASVCAAQTAVLKSQEDKSSEQAW